MKFLPILCLLPLLAAPMQGSAEVSLLKSSQPENVIVNNRVLAKVNGRPISVIDLMKKMDMLFYREFPQYTSFPEARFQFYQANWKAMLQEIIDKELITADAEENKLPVTSGEVRQEMEQLFGPNIITNLDKIGMTFDEAWKIIQGDLLLHRMLYIRVNSKAIREVTPSSVYSYYEEYAKQNIQPEQWSYRVVSIRDKDPAVGAVVANIAHQYLAEDGVDVSEVAKKVKALSIATSSQVGVSEMFLHTDKEIAPSYREALLHTQLGTYSEPIAQKSKDNSMVFRFFFLDGYSPGGAPSFDNLQGKLKETLISKEIAEKTKAYLKKLQAHFDVQEMMPEGFEPFELR